MATVHRKDLIKPDGRRLYLYSRTSMADDIVATNPLHEPFTPNPQLRWHPLRGEWVAYASHRQGRTFLPPKEYSPLAVTKSTQFPTELPHGSYDVAVFENLFPSLCETAGSAPDTIVPTKPATGVCEVIVFSQNPDTSLGALDVSGIRLILEVLGDRTREIGSRPGIEYVMPFENRGVEVGVTLHHPHGQIYAYPLLPPVPARMNAMEEKHWREAGRTLLGDLVRDEIKDGRRLVLDEQEREPLITAFVPVCARYAYETWIAPVRSVPYLYELTSDELDQLARTMKRVLTKFDMMWERPFPYLMTLYQAPTKGATEHAHVHFEIYPAYRTRDKLKFLAGTEIGAGLFVNDSWPEEKALELRNVKI